MKRTHMGWVQQASTSAERVDTVFLWILVLSALFLVGITAAMILFVVRYSRKRRPVAAEVGSHALLEATWTAVPLILFLGMFYFGWTNFRYIREAPRDAMVVKVIARQWAWDFEYPNGKQTSVLYAALGKPVKVEITSKDVIHGFFVPAFRLKMDAVPGKVNTTWFEPTRLGSYDIECTVICGASHSYMLSSVTVVPVEAFKEWYFGPADAPPPDKRPAPAEAKAAPAAQEPPGLALLKAKDCLVCHSLDGEVMVGPTFKGLYGSEETLSGTAGPLKVKVDEAFLEKAIRRPGETRVVGYPPTMPVVELSDQELAAVIEYLRILK
jgi:cytochrome c oxidase subunit II